MSAPNDLTTLAAVKQWLGLSSDADDASLDSLVSAISQAILADLGRPSILPTNHTEILDGGNADELVLRHWPVTEVLFCTADGGALPESSGPGHGGFALEAAETAPPGAMQRLFYRGGAFPPGRRNVMVAYRAGYEILGEAATVPASAPYIVTAAAPFGAWSLDTGCTGASGGYSVTNGVYSFSAAAAGQPIMLNYGYVPRDLTQAANEWIADRYAARSRIGQSAKTLGGQETTSFVVKAMPDVVSRLLQPYRSVAR
jgi:hypothetical protein